MFHSFHVVTYAQVQKRWRHSRTGVFLVHGFSTWPLLSYRALFVNRSCLALNASIKMTFLWHWYCLIMLVPQFASCENRIYLVLDFNSYWIIQTEGILDSKRSVWRSDLHPYLQAEPNFCLRSLIWHCISYQVWNTSYYLWAAIISKWLFLRKSVFAETRIDWIKKKIEIVNLVFYFPLGEFPVP